MAYTNFTNCTEQEYLDIIYSQDDKNRIRIWFNNVELEDAGEYCESLSGTNRILPDDGKKAFSLGNFISKEYDLILRDLPQNTIVQDQVKISIGTLVGENTYEDVPLGVFNIQNEPKTDKNKITITLRDNRVKFDFYYNAKPLIEANNGKANYYQILNDICNQAGVANNVGHFEYDDTQISIYDNTIKAATYVGYLAEQCGKIPQIDRNGALIFVDLLSDKETQSKGKNFTISSISKTKVDDIELIGETTQETTTGKNLLKLKNTTDRGLTTTINEDGSINVSGTATETIAYLDTGESTNLSAGTYTFSIQNTLSVRPRLFLYNGSTQVGAPTISIGSLSATLTTTQAITNYSLIFLDLVVGTSYNFKIYPMLESGSSATSFEPYTYGASPNPNYPQEVVNVTGRQEIKCVGTNLIGLDTQQYKVNLSAGDKITLRNTGSSSLQLNLYTNYGDSTRNDYWSVSSGSTRTITVAYDTKAIAWNINVSSNGVAWVNKGESILTYEPYQEQVNEINLGKNLFDKDNINLIADSYVDGTGKIVYGANNKFNWVKLEPNTTYTLSQQITSNVNIRVGLFSTTPARNVTGTILGTFSNGNPIVQTFTTTSTNIYLGWVYCNTGSLNNHTEQQMLDTIQIEVGSQATSYSEYFTPIELCKIGTYEDKIFKTTGKNLSTLDNYTNNVSGVYYVDKKLLNNFENNTTYTLSFDITSTITPFRVSVGYGNNSFEADMTGGTLNNQNNGHITLTFTTNNTTYNNLWLRAPRYTSTTTYQASVSNIMLVKGTQEAEYEPFGSYNEWYVKKNIGKKILNGSESWGTIGDNRYWVAFSDKRGLTSQVPCLLMSNYFKATQYAGGAVGIGEMTEGYYTIANYNVFFNYNGTNTDLAGFKTWLSTHNTIVYYVLATPTYTKLNDKLQEELNNIYLVEGLNNIVSTIPITFEYYKPKQPIRIPLSIVEKYELGTPYKVERVVYESGTVKFETSNNKTLDTLYLDAANMYINSQKQIDNIFDTFRTLNIDSVTTGKILGNPAIDSYDIIEVYDDEDENETIIFKTFANLEYTFNGVHRHKFDTQIGKEERVENVSINSGATFQKIAKSEIDSLNGTITNVVSETNTVSAIVIGTYGLTEDTNFQADKNYYILNTNNEYELYENYTVGDTIPADTIYELTGSKIQELDKNYGILDKKIDDTNDETIKELQKYTDSAIKVSKGDIELSFNTKYKDYTDMNTATNGRIDAIHQYLRYLQEDNSVRLGISTENIELVLKNNKIYFYDKTSSEEVAYISENKLYITNAQILTSIQIGNFTFIPRSNGSLGFRKVS